MKLIRFKNRIFQILFLSFSVMLVAPVCILAVVYQQTTKTLTEEIQYYNQNLLNQCMNAAEEVFDTVDHVLNALSFNENIHEFLKPNTYAGSSYLEKTQKAYIGINAYRDLFQYTGILDVMVYAGKSDAVVSQIAPYSRMEYYDKIIRYASSKLSIREEMALHNRESYILPENELYIYNNQEMAVTFFKPIIIDYCVSDGDGLAAFVSTEKFSKFLRQMNLGDTGLACIMDEKDRILLQLYGEKGAPVSSLEQTDFSSRDYLKISAASQESGRHYVAFIPKSVVLSKVSYLRTLIYCLCLLEVLAGIATAWLLSYKNAKPVMDLFQLLGSQNEKTEKRDYNFLKGSISSLVAGNQTLNEELQRQVPIVRSDFIHRLLQGTISPNALKNTARHLGCDLEGSQYSVLMIKNLGYGDILDPVSLKELENAAILQRQAFAQAEEFRMYSFPWKEQVQAMLLIFDGQEYQSCLEQLEKAVSRIDRLLGNQFHLPLAYFCGGFCGQLEQLPQVYENAKYMVTHVFPPVRGRISYYQRRRDPLPAVYPIEEESRLIKTVILGQTERIAPIIQSLYEKNQNGDQPEAGPDIQLLNGWLYLTILRIAASLGDTLLHEDAEFLNETGYQEPEESGLVMKRVIQLLEQASSRVNRNKQVSEQQTKDEILLFMAENLSNSNFTLYDVAVRFNYVEGYLYRMFRERFGCTFFSKLEQMRLELACQELSKGISIDDVAIRCGYNSSHAFRRAFKKWKGMLPSDYRESVKEAKEIPCKAEKS